MHTHEPATAPGLDQSHYRLRAVAPHDVAAKPAPRGSLTRVSWSAPPDLELAEWIDQGRRIGTMGRSAGWWIGDWLRYGNAKYGEKYARARNITGYDTQTLMNMVWVCSRIEISRRREKLSWSHHADVAALDTLTQEQLLNHAEAEHLSVRDVRELVRGERRANRGDEPENDPVKRASVVCPQCGHSFAAR